MVSVSQFAGRVGEFSTNPYVRNTQKYGRAGSVGIVDTYFIGDVFTNHNNTKKTLEEMKNNQEITEKKSGFLRKMASGIGNTITLALPIYGTYKLGKIKNEQEEMQKEIEAMKNPGKEIETKKQTPNYLRGLCEKFKFIIPVYNIIYGVKTVSTERQMNNDIKELSKNYKPQTEEKTAA